MPTRLAVIGDVVVTQDDDGKVHWTSGAAIDADGGNGQNGNPFAYRADDQGLDALANAGWPDGPWRDVLVDDGTGRPLDDGHGNLYSRTTYAWRDRPIPSRFVDATAVPYVVVNPIVRRAARGVVIGCRARVAFGGTSIDAVVADVGGSERIGEVSAFAARALAIPPSPRDGGVPGKVLFEIWPGIAATVGGISYALQPA